MPVVKIAITETRYHTVEIDTSAYDESVTHAIEQEDGEFFSDWISEKTLDNGEFEFDGVDEVPAPL